MLSIDYANYRYSIFKLGVRKVGRLSVQCAPAGTEVWYGMVYLNAVVNYSIAVYIV